MARTPRPNLNLASEVLQHTQALIDGALFPSSLRFAQFPHAKRSALLYPTEPAPIKKLMAMLDALQVVGVDGFTEDLFDGRSKGLADLCPSRHQSGVISHHGQ
jgi:hypothetical protein